MNNNNRRYSRRQVLQVASGLAAGSLFTGCTERRLPNPGVEQSPLTIFYNGTVLPVDQGFSEQQALAIRGKHVVALGSNDAMLALAGENTQKIDLAGRTVLPGFIEPHIHFSLLSLTSGWHDIGPLKYESTAEALAALKRKADQSPGQGWILGCQFDPSLQKGPAMLTTRELDRVSDTRPIYVLNASGHLAYVNSVTLRLAGIKSDTPDPPGERYFRDRKGAPNGAMTSKVSLRFLLANPEVREALQSGAVETGLGVGDEASALGITTLCDMATGALGGYAEFENFQRMFATGRMKTRVRAYMSAIAAQAIDQSEARPGLGDANVRIAGWKIVSDGSNQGRTGWQFAPYLNSTEHGMHYVEPMALKAMVSKRAAAGWPLAIHGNGDAAIDSILNAIESATEAGLDMRALRCRIEHSSILHDEQIARMQRLGVSPSFLINHVYYWGQTMRDNVFGEKKAQLLDRCASVENAGIAWTMHSDAPVSRMGTLHKIRVAVARDLWREPGNILAPEERVSVEAAIRAVTINAAWQCHSEHEIGSLEKGKLADLVILESDPRKVAPVQLSSIKVSETWMNGRQVYRA